MFNKEKSEVSERGKFAFIPPWLRLTSGLTLGLLITLLILCLSTVFLFAPNIYCALYECSSEGFSESPEGFDEILLFSLALIGASATFTIAIWRGRQIYAQISKAEEQIEKAQEQIRETQEQNRLTRFQNAVEMATEKENKGRCISGFKVLEDMYEGLKPEDKENVRSVALDILSKNYVPFESRRPPSISGHRKDIEEIKFREGPKVSRTARQRAFDFLLREGFFDRKTDSKGNDVPKHKLMLSKDFARLQFVKRGENGLNLSGVFFRNCDFFGANLSKVNFSEARFTDSKLYGTNLSETNFTGARGIPREHLSFAYYSEKYGSAIGLSPDAFKKIDKWPTWKKYFVGAGERDLEAERKAHGITTLTESEWGYMVNLAEEDAEHPPGEDHPEASEI